MADEQAAADSGTVNGGSEGESNFDMAGAVDSIGADLFPSSDDTGADDTGADDTGANDTGTDDAGTGDAGADAKSTADAAATTTATRQPPQSWKKEMHEKFLALPPEVQEYVELRENQMREGLEKDRGDAVLGRTMRDVMTPYRELLQSQGVDEPRAVQYLLNAHYKLTSDPVNTFIKMAEQYGVDMAQIVEKVSANKPEGVSADPAFKALQDELNGIKTTLTASQQAAFKVAKERVSGEVEAFANDPAHPYFDEVADDIVAFLHQGHDIKTAYEKAVWANPVTRQKEVDRLKEEAATSASEKARQAVEAAKRNAGNTIRNRDTRRVPTEPKGSMKDLDGSLRDTLKEIKNRTH